MTNKRMLELIVQLAQVAHEFPEFEAGAFSEIAKLVVKDLPKPEPIPAPAPRVDVRPTIDEVILAFGSKIEAIKSHRYRTGIGIKESKDAIESAMARVQRAANPALHDQITSGDVLDAIRTSLDFAAARYQGRTVGKHLAECRSAIWHEVATIEAAILARHKENGKVAS